MSFGDLKIKIAKKGTICKQNKKKKKDLFEISDSFLVISRDPA